MLYFVWRIFVCVLLIIYFLKKNYLFLAVLVLHCHVQALSSCGKRGLLFVGVQSCGFSCWGAWGLGMQASAAATHGLLQHWLSRCGAGT